MQYRNLGNSGLKVPALSFGTGTFGGEGAFFAAWGGSKAEEARRLVDICLEAGVNLFDSADVYSSGAAEAFLGAAVKGRRDKVLISTKIGLPMGAAPDEAGTSRHRLLRGVDAALLRLGTDYIDLLQLHAFDAFTPIEETLYTLDLLVRSGKVRYVGASNFSGWQLMKSLAIADRYGWPRHVAHQVYYSLIGRDYEWELMPLPKESRLHVTAQAGPPVDDERLYEVVDELESLARETGKTVPQIAIAWLLTRPTVSSVIIGARNEAQLRDNLAAADCQLTAGQIRRLDAASATMPAYPYFPYRVQEGFARVNPPSI
jgi:aryl-alcohol dehydrogenase-like predicted oxidoreductase